MQVFGRHSEAIPYGVGYPYIPHPPRPGETMVDNQDTGETQYWRNGEIHHRIINQGREARKKLGLIPSPPPQPKGWGDMTLGEQADNIMNMRGLIATGDALVALGIARPYLNPGALGGGALSSLLAR